MNFESSVSDFTVLGQRAWKIYKACKDSPQDFKNASQEVLSLLKEVDKIYLEAALPADQQSRLRTVVDGCRGVLEDLQGSLDKYNNLSTSTKRTWDRLGWGSKDIATLRSRLISNTVLRTTFVNTSQPTVQEKLDAFMQEFRVGKRECSIVSTQTADSLSADERQAWRTIGEKLEEIGICVAAFDANKGFIRNWFRTAISTEAFDEPTAEDGPVIISSEDDPFQDPGHGTVLNQPPLEDAGHDTENSTSTSINPQPLISSEEPRIQRRSPSRRAGLIKCLRLVRDSKELFKALQSNDETRMQQLLERGVDINVQYYYGKLPLHCAVSSKSETMVRVLLQNGANVDARTSGSTAGNTALYLAATLGQETIVQRLLSYGAKIDETSTGEMTALHGAAECGHDMVVQLLLEKGAKINQNGKYGYTALHIAAQYGHETTVDLLLKNGAEIHAKDGHGSAALHLAAGHGHARVVQLLLRSGAEMNEKNGQGYTPVALANRWEKFEVVKVLEDIRYRAHVNSR